MQLPARALAAALLAAPLLFSSGPAKGACPAGDGVLPGTRSQTYTIGPVYVDDRGGNNATDWDGDGSNGLWLYFESNGRAGLQRGGAQVVFRIGEDRGVPPRIPPVKIGSVSLFPHGYPPGDEDSPWAKEAGLYDRCRQADNPDLLLY